MGRTMKVIRSGNIGKESKQFTCRECNALLEVNAGDLTYKSSPKPNDDSFTFTCPECGRDNWVDSALIPSRMRR